MNKQNLIAPEHYNLVKEFEKFAVDEEKLALIWESEDGEQKKVHTSIYSKELTKLPICSPVKASKKVT